MSKPRRQGAPHPLNGSFQIVTWIMRYASQLILASSFSDCEFVGRSLKIDGTAVFCAPDTTPKGEISSEFVIYQGRKLKFPRCRWYLRWKDGSKPRWQRCDSFP